MGYFLYWTHEADGRPSGSFLQLDGNDGLGHWMGVLSVIHVDYRHHSSSRLASNPDEILMD
jgi:hypothetical protein